MKKNSEIIGKGPLEIGVIIGDEVKLSEVRLKSIEELLRETLSIEPLGKIFNARILGTDLNVDIERALKQVDQVVIIKKRTLSRYEDNIVYSQEEIMDLAHELGHSLGLKHFKSVCGDACGKENYVKNFCSEYFGKVMCGKENGSKPSFHPDNLTKLRRWYLE